MDEGIEKETKTNQPCLWCEVDEGMLEQIFLVVDKGIFFELQNKSYNLHALLVLLGFYFAFNLSYNKRQDLIFQFVQEFALGLQPPKKSVRYRTACMLLVPDKLNSNLKQISTCLPRGKQKPVNLPAGG